MGIRCHTLHFLFNIIIYYTLLWQVGLDWSNVGIHIAAPFLARIPNVFLPRSFLEVLLAGVGGVPLNFCLNLSKYWTQTLLSSEDPKPVTWYSSGSELAVIIRQVSFNAVVSCKLESTPNWVVVLSTFGFASHMLRASFLRRLTLICASER